MITNNADFYSDWRFLFLQWTFPFLFAILLIIYQFSETERLKFNISVKKVSNEINYNIDKLPRYKPRMDYVRNKWENREVTSKENVDWINENERTSGYNGYIYNFFKFDAYNHFINSGMHLYLDHSSDYHLKGLYHHSKKFCARTQQIEETIHFYHNLAMHDNSNYDINIHYHWNLIEDEYNNISNIFGEIGDLKSFHNRHISWCNWHSKAIKAWIKRRLDLMR